MKLHLLPTLACIALLSATLHAAEPIPYPSTNCIVSDEKLGEMGPPVMIDYKGQMIGFCCKSCIGDFDKDPAKYLAKLQATSAKP
jgi:YHS domain-containing protein